MTALAGGNASSSYGICKRAGLDSLVSALGLSPAQLGENLDVGYKRNEPADAAETPDALARSFCALPTTKKPFDTSPPDTALRAAAPVVVRVLLRVALGRAPAGHVAAARRQAHPQLAAQRLALRLAAGRRRGHAVAQARPHRRQVRARHGGSAARATDEVAG